jgi:CheY-like chemotaxis protein
MQKKQILIVEDEVIVADALARTLKHLGYEVASLVESGDEAIEKAEAVRPDLVLMDIVLSGDMDGIEAAQHIRAKLKIPVVFLTAHTETRLVDRARISEPYGYLVKPVGEAELRAAIEVGLYKHEMDTRLKASQEELSVTLNSIGDGVISANADGSVISMNPSAEELTGWTENEARGKLVGRCLPYRQ